MSRCTLYCLNSDPDRKMTETEFKKKASDMLAKILPEKVYQDGFREYMHSLRLDLAQYYNTDSIKLMGNHEVVHEEVVKYMCKSKPYHVDLARIWKELEEDDDVVKLETVADWINASVLQTQISNIDKMTFELAESFRQRRVCTKLIIRMLEANVLYSPRPLGNGHDLELVILDVDDAPAAAAAAAKPRDSDIGNEE